MNANHPTKDSKLWHHKSARLMPVEGYTAWMKVELAEGIADLDAGRTAPIVEVRKEFGIE